jgi:hypothetical protein
MNSLENNKTVVASQQDHNDSYNEMSGRQGCRLVNGRHIWTDKYTRRISPRCSGFISTGVYLIKPD